MTTGLNCIIIHPFMQSALLPFQTLALTLILHKPTRVRHAHHHPDAMREIRSGRPNDDDARASADAAIRRHRPRVRER